MSQDFEYYETNRYKNKRNRKMTLFIDIDNHCLSGGSATPFNIRLTEPLLIDKSSEIYIDSLITFNSMMADTSERSCFSIKLNEFNLNNGVAVDGKNQELKKNYTSIVIPNENRSINNFYKCVSHKAKKFNYICDINPTKLHSISGYITDLSGKPIFNGNNKEYKYTYAITSITGWKTKGLTPTPAQGGARKCLYSNEIASLTYGKTTGSTNNISIIILNNAIETDSIIYFATKETINDTDGAGAGAGGIIEIIVKSNNTLANETLELSDGFLIDIRETDEGAGPPTNTDAGFSSANKAKALIELTIVSKE